MDERSTVRLRPTREADLDFVLRLERDGANSPWVGSWSRAEHAAAIAAPDREHWIIEAGGEGPAGYLIGLDLRASGRGVHIKRMVVQRKGCGIGRQAVAGFVRHAFADLRAPFVWLDVLAGNARARAAYRAAGFELRPLPRPQRADWAAAVGGFEDDSLVMVHGAPPPAPGGPAVSST